MAVTPIETSLMDLVSRAGALRDQITDELKTHLANRALLQDQVAAVEIQIKAARDMLRILEMAAAVPTVDPASITAGSVSTALPVP
jgi:hypothetical protein